MSHEPSSPAELNGREVSCRIAGHLVAELTRRGLPPQALLDGLGHSLDELQDLNERISWTAFRHILIRAAQVWSDDEMIAVGVSLMRSPRMRIMTAAASLLYTAREYYRVVFDARAGTVMRLFTCLESELHDNAEDRLQVSLAVRRGYEPCRELFLLAHGAIMGMSEVVGSGPASVRRKESRYGAAFTVEIPAARPWLTRCLRAVTWPWRSRAAARELRQAHELLYLRYRQLSDEAAQRQRLILELEKRNAELERFTRMVFHDLRAPLFTAKGFLGLAREATVRSDPEALEERMAGIDRSVDAMVGLIEDLTRFLAIDPFTCAREEVDLAQLARRAVAGVAERWPDRQLEVTISPHLPVVRGDAKSLQEALFQVIDNAFKFQAPGVADSIEIGVQELSNRWVCHVRDRGIGVDPPYLERIFRVFEQLDPEREGTGIGLAIVKRVFDKHQGRVWMESEGRGKGATLRFELASPEMLSP